MKSIKKIFVSILLVLLCSCSSAQEVGFIDSSAEEVLNKITNLDTFVFMIAHEDSYANKIFIEESEELIEKNNISVYTVYEDKIDETLKEQLEIALGRYNSWPVLFYIKEGTITSKDKYEYCKDPEGWQIWMEDTGLIHSDK